MQSPKHQLHAVWVGLAPKFALRAASARGPLRVTAPYNPAGWVRTNFLVRRGLPGEVAQRVGCRGSPTRQPSPPPPPPPPPAGLCSDETGAKPFTNMGPPYLR